MVDLKGRMLHVPRTKNENPLHVPLNDVAMAALKAVRGKKKTGPVFESERTGERLEDSRHWFNDALEDARIKGFDWHDLRHTFASRLRMKGAVLEDIADLLGHKSLAMTRCSNQLTPELAPAKLKLK